MRYAVVIESGPENFSACVPTFRGASRRAKRWTRSSPTFVKPPSFISSWHSPKNQQILREFDRRGEGVEPSGERNARQAGFEDRWGHRAPSSSIDRFYSPFALIKSLKEQC